MCVILLAVKTLILLAASASLALGSAHTETEKAVRAAHDAFNDAVRKGDGPTMAKYLADELAYAHSNAKMETKAEAVAALTKAKSHFELLPGSVVNVYGNTAVWHGKMTAHNMQNGKAVDVHLHMVQVWVKKGGNWVMVNRHTVRLPQ